ncbi:MAG: type II CRISPR RNA-guided endonuclease Cas9 [Rhodobacteraceae bacterium]|nr:type II CRISPR RNA-guided endonuclease Cas9 [Paracoccaceae bacterium]
MQTRLGLDIGTNSIGWWLYELEGEEIARIIDGGVRIFPDGRDSKSKSSLAVDRRIARSMRRRRDRYLRRREVLMRRLVDAGLMPGDSELVKKKLEKDPYALRARGLREELSLHELGRVLFHLNQRRGFKSNRKTDRGDNESGKIKDATARLDHDMMAKGARTYGEFLNMRRSETPEKPEYEGKPENKDGTRQDDRRTKPVRTRMSVARRGGPDAREEDGYDFYPDRRHLEEEFEKLWAAQEPHHPRVLTDALRDALFRIIFYQRPLKEPEIGLCQFENEPRLPKSHPLFQHRVLYETVNNLRITRDGDASRPLTLAQRDTITLLDAKKPTKTLASMQIKLPALAKALKLPKGERFTLQTANRDAIACDAVRASLAHPDRMAGLWSKLDEDTQIDIVARIRAVQSDAEFNDLVNWLQDKFSLPEDQARETANAPLPEGYGRLGETATRRILDVLKSDVVTYDKAVAACGWHHSDTRTGEVLDKLPYYGAVLDKHVIPGSRDESKHNPEDQAAEYYGRITNPTVHIGLNQIRRLVNRIIDVYGKPHQIVMELARELKQSKKQKDAWENTNKNNRKAAEQRSRKLVELGQEDTGANRMILRLWEYLNKDDCMKRFCPYTGERISAGMLFDGSCDVDHILPYSRTLDDSFANRTLCLRAANREKRNHTPWEAWGGTAQWSVIEANLHHLPDNKHWRFAPDAMDRFEGERDFLDRAIVDTQYLSRIARDYLDTLFTEGGHVWVVTGRMTAMLRRHWGLNSLLPDHDKDTAKNRTDHRHHAIDAAVIAATDRALVQRIARAAGRDEGDGQSAERVAREIAPPWDGFRKDIRDRVDRIIVSHRADHGSLNGTVGALHEATAMDWVDKHHVATRIPVNKLEPSHLIEGGKSDTLRDEFLRTKLARATDRLEGKAFEHAVTEWFSRPGPYYGTRRVRVLKALGEKSRVCVQHKNTDKKKVYQGGSNHRFEIWRMPDGEIIPQVVTVWEFHNLKTPKRPHPAAKRLLSVHKNDMVAIERDGNTRICSVQKTSVGVGAVLVPHNEADADARRRRKEAVEWFQMSATSLIKGGIRRVFVDGLGRVRDPGRPVWAGLT